MMHSELISSVDITESSSPGGNPLLRSPVVTGRNQNTHRTNEGEFPISSATTYEPEAAIHPLSSASSSPSNNNNDNTSSNWDYDNFIEKPRGHVAQPHYLGNKQPSQPYIPLEQTRGFSSLEEGNSPYNSTSSSNYETVTQQSSLGLSPALLAVLSYFFGWFGGFIVMLLEKKNVFIIFHGWQSFASGVIAFIIQLLFIFSSTMYTLLWIVYLIFTFGMIVRVISDAPSQRLFKLPLIGDWCEHRALNKIHYHTGSGTFYRMR